MSTTQRNADACTIAVSPGTANVLRDETLKVLEFTHEYFEDLRDFTPVGQEALARVFTDAITILNTIGWDPGEAINEPIDIPLTAGYIEQLRRRRVDLAQTNADRLAAQTVDDVIAAYTRVIRA